LSNDPHSTDLFPEIRLAPAPASPRTKVARADKRGTLSVSAQVPVPVVPATALDPAPASYAEAMARTLEAHPDYRVQRRLKPTLHWNDQALAPVAITRVLVLDTETTGLDHSKDKIIELALLRVDVDTFTGLPVGEVQVYDGLEDPGMPIPKDAAAITGITDADVRGQHLDEARIAQLLEGVDVVVAHNAGFDRPFMEARLAQFRHLAWSCSFADIDWKAQGRSSAKLENLAQALGLFYDAHRAEMDCHALLAVLAAPLPIAPEAGPHTGLAQLLEAAHHPTYRLQASHAPFDAKDKLKARGYRWNADQKVWHTRLNDELALQQECEWLKPNVYNGRAVVVQVEKQTALVKYSTRSGEMLHWQL
jgi:DNA polymerase-3 subunit epsilon